VVNGFRPPGKEKARLINGLSKNCPGPDANCFLMQQRHIPHHLEWLAIGILAFDIPHINTLLAKLTLVITVPRDIYVVTLEN
jgi:hypothetical protein